MIKIVDRLAHLYNKIETGTASNCEKVEYEITMNTSCIKEDILIKAVKSRANDLKNNKIKENN